MAHYPVNVGKSRPPSMQRPSIPDIPSSATRKSETTSRAQARNGNDPHEHRRDQYEVTVMSHRLMNSIGRTPQPATAKSETGNREKAVRIAIEIENQVKTQKRTIWNP
jgi:hypothetical protein